MSYAKSTGKVDGLGSQRERPFDVHQVAEIAKAYLDGGRTDGDEHAITVVDAAPTKGNAT